MPDLPLLITSWSDDRTDLAFGGTVAGENNTLGAEGTSLVGGARNSATTIGAAILAEYDNLASGAYADLTDVTINQATGPNASVWGDRST
jgi:hypothetical protein